MRKEVRHGAYAVSVSLGKALVKRAALSSARAAVVRALGKVPWLDYRSRADILSMAMGIARERLSSKGGSTAEFMARRSDEIVKAFNRAQRHTWARTKGTEVKTAMKWGNDHGRVFYLVSSHQLPAEGHRGLQGKILVNSRWRQASTDEETKRRIGAYVKNRKVLSVQKAMGAPYYLITRPYCRHYLISLRTRDVLEKSPRKVKEECQPKRTNVPRPKTDAERRAEARALRAEIEKAIRAYEERKARRLAA